jgi:hypothetical protein
MKKRKCDWCYFTDGSKKKITNYYHSGEDILFFIDGKLYLYKKDGFGLEYEDLFARTRQNLIYPILPRGRFYIHRSPTLHYSSGYYDKDNDDEWTITNIEKIELRQ